MAQALIGKSAVKSLVADDGKVALKQLGKQLSRIWMLRRELREDASIVRALNHTCLSHLRPVSSPIALISQIQRSGGTLLSQLFDGHTEVYAHPHEFKIGYPRKDRWPVIALDDKPARCFEVLFEDVVVRHFRQGYEKGRKGGETFPFLLVPSLQKRIFCEYLQSLGSTRPREVLNAYMTSYFGAWLNYQNMNGDKKYITAFAAKLAMHEPSMAAFFGSYPDGRLISIVRDPRNWFPSALRLDDKGRKYKEIRPALSQWKDNAAAMLLNRGKYGNRVCILKFEDLVSRTEPVMRYLAEFLGIEFNSILLVPTFNGTPIKANTSFQADRPKIVSGTLERHKTCLAF